jgi:hypothetical protein
MQGLEKQVESIKSKEDFVRFFSALINNFQSQPHCWVNKDLSSYLGAIQSWVEDMDGYYVNTNQPVPNKVDWKVFAQIMTAARVYE